jgi:hypothetical protein
MKTSFALLALFVSVSAFAQEMTCLDKLLPFNRFSGLHHVSRDEWYDGKETLSPEGVRAGVAFLTNVKLLCRNDEVVIRVEPVCTAIVPDLPQSNTCFVFTNVGYFVVSRDNNRNTNFIFSRERRFRD